MHQQGPIGIYWANFVDGAFPCGWQPDFYRIPCRFTVMLPRCKTLQAGASCPMCRARGALYLSEYRARLAAKALSGSLVLPR
jgi:hypothetical protein